MSVIWSPSGQGLGKHAAICHFHSAAFHENNDPMEDARGTDSSDACLRDAQPPAQVKDKLMRIRRLRRQNKTKQPFKCRSADRLFEK
jgi:hypothetical protein